MARILLVEDDASLGDLLRSALERAGHATSLAVDAFGALALLPEVRPELVLLDLNLPDHSGFEVLQHIRRQSDVPVIILTARTDSADKVRGLDLGADDYVTKPFWNEELLARIRARLRRGDAPPPTDTLVFGDLEVDLGARVARVEGADVHLTPTELGLLSYLGARAGRAVRREQLIAEVLTGADATDAALLSHISRLRRKLGPEGGRVATVWGIGYRLDP